MSHKATMEKIVSRLPRPKGRRSISLCSDWFQNLVQWPFWQTALIIVGVLAGNTFLFAGVYDVLGPFPCPTDANASAMTTFPDLLLYSTSVTSSLLQARCIPMNSDAAMVVANLQGWLMLLVTVFLTGVVFTRMAQPGMKVTVSKHMLLGYRDSHLGTLLTTRLFFNSPRSSLIDAKFNVMFSRQVRKGFFKTDLLELVRPEAPILVVGTSIMHRIDESSPLYGLTIEALQRMQAWFVVTLQGTEASTMQTVIFSQMYLAGSNQWVGVRDADTAPTSDLVDGRRYAFTDVATNDGANRSLDFSLIDSLSEIAPAGGGGEGQSQADAGGGRAAAGAGAGLAAGGAGIGGSVNRVATTTGAIDPDGVDDSGWEACSRPLLPGSEAKQRGRAVAHEQP